MRLLENAGDIINSQVEELDLAPSTYFASLKYLERYARKVPEIDVGVQWMNLDALVALRLALKHNETQQDHLMQDDESSTQTNTNYKGESSSTYQKLLDKMVKTIVELELLPQSEINEDSIGSVVQLREYQILIANDWNLMVNNGYDFVHMLAKEKEGPIWHQLKTLVSKNIKQYFMASG